jgi:hypothetical protein
MNQHPLYWVWINMIRRCANPTEKSYARYGGRGIKVCERWKSFNNFVADMGKRPAGTTLDRTDNSGDYCKDNCKWSTRHEQHRNTRTNVHITIDDRTMIYKDWVIESGLPGTTVSNRIKRGWTMKQALGIDPVPPIKSRTVSGHRGVYLNKKSGKWKASGCAQYKKIHIGEYDKIQEAIDAVSRFYKVKGTHYLRSCKANEESAGTAEDKTGPHSKLSYQHRLLQQLASQGKVRQKS